MPSNWSPPLWPLETAASWPLFLQKTTFCVIHLRLRFLHHERFSLLGSDKFLLPHLGRLGNRRLPSLEMARAHPTSALFLLLLFIPVSPNSITSHLDSGDKGFISVFISENGLNFAKDVLVEKAVNSLAPLQLPDIVKFVNIPVIGGAKASLSNIILTHVNVSSSMIHVGDSGIVIDAVGATANLSLDWQYSYGTWLIPIKISDSGNAHVQVEDMEIGLTITMKNEGGNLKLAAIEYGCHVKDIVITLAGRTSWLYQGWIDAFGDQIRYTVEKSITRKIIEGIVKLDSLLQTVPKEINVDDVLALNVTFIDDPFLGDLSVEFDIAGLFGQTSEAQIADLFISSTQHSLLCDETSKMIGISLDEAVFNSASTAYFDAGMMHLTVDKASDQSLLNTAAWKYIIPQLYKKYPNDDMKLNISLTSAPAIKVTSNNIGTTIYSDMIVEVLHAGETVPVACIAVTLTASGVMEISGNNIGGQAKLEGFSLNLNWSKVGNFHMYLIEKTMQTFLNKVFMPYVNLHLRKGFPLPIIHGFTIQNASILSAESTIIVCSDVMVTSLNLQPQ